MAGRWFPFRSVFYLWKNAKIYYQLLFRRETPLYLKALVVAAAVYLVSPYDLIPEWLVGFGLVDDIAVVSLILGFVARRLQKIRPDIEDKDEDKER